MKKPLRLTSLVLFASLVLAACGPGQMFGPSITPSPTVTLTPTITQSPTPSQTPAPTQTFTATPIPPTSTPTIPPLPKIGHWQGNPDVSFDIKANGVVYNFSMTVPFGNQNSGNTCKLTPKPFNIEENGAFIVHEWIKNQMQKEIDLAAALGLPTPESTQTASGEMIAAVTITGQVRSETNLLGTYVVVMCGGSSQFNISGGPAPTWSAQWKTP